MSDKDTGNTFVIGFVVGAVVGLAIGFLYAPKPGAETRELLKEKTEKAKEQAGQIIEKAKEKAAQIRKSGEEKLKGAEEEAS